MHAVRLILVVVLVALAFGLLYFIFTDISTAGGLSWILLLTILAGIFLVVQLDKGAK